jgi:hypothetical protein
LQFARKVTCTISIEVNVNAIEIGILGSHPVTLTSIRVIVPTTSKSSAISEFVSRRRSAGLVPSRKKLLKSTLCCQTMSSARAVLNATQPTKSKMELTRRRTNDEDVNIGCVYCYSRSIIRLAFRGKRPRASLRAIIR